MTETVKESVYNLEYNSERPRLIIPEYGRHLQKLISQCVEIEDREERNKAANYIIDVMGSLNPHLRDVPDFKHKLWDQIFIMSEFKLDVDSPYPIISPEMLNARPERLDYPQKTPKYRFYGNNIIAMIKKAREWEEGELKNLLIQSIANTMKKSYLVWNKDTVNDQVIFDHLYELSKGEIDLRDTAVELTSSNKIIHNQNFKTSQKPKNSNQKSKNNHKKNNSNNNKKRFQPNTSQQ